MPDPFRLPPPMTSRVPFGGPYSGACWENVTAEARMAKVKAAGRKTNRLGNMLPPFISVGPTVQFSEVHRFAASLQLAGPPTPGVAQETWAYYYKLLDLK